jgi:hypothetical protein
MISKFLKVLNTPASCREKGDILILTIIFMFLGFVIITPLVCFMGTGVKTGTVYNNKSAALYAADAGIEDAKWHIKYDQLTGKFSDYDPPYDSYDFITPWAYELPLEDGQPEINNQDVTITLNNVWIPKDITTPDKATANGIINDTRLMVAGGGYNLYSYSVAITYNAGAGEDLQVDTLGVWLPPGYTYKANSSNLGSNPETEPYQGGQSVIWTFSPAVDFTSLPGANPTDSPMTATITFDYYLNGATPTLNDAKPDSVSWINTSNVDGLSFCWDNTVKVFHVTSAAGGTIVETYLAKSELRKMGGAVNGDYFATGARLMKDTAFVPDGVRDTLCNGSATVGPPNPAGADNGIPQDANIAASYLYWGTWFRNNTGRFTSLLNDDCSDFFSTGGYFDNGSGWNKFIYNIPSSYYCFTAHYPSDTPDSARLLTEHNSLDLHSYASSTYITAISWEQWVSDFTSIYPLNPDTCSNFNAWDRPSDSSWIKPTGSNYFRGHYQTGATNRVLPLLYGMDLSSYDPNTVTISWSQWESSIASGDGLNFELSSDGGATWSSPIKAFDYSDLALGNIGTSPSTFTYTLTTSAYLTNNFKIRFSLVGFSASGHYAYIDNIAVNVPAPTYSSDDKLEFAISNDAGVTWSNYITAFTGDKIGTSGFASTAAFQFNIPVNYLTQFFKVKLHIVGFNGPGQYCNVRNIRISALNPDTGLTFKINNGGGDKIVYFDTDGNPADSLSPTDQIVSTRTQALITYSYSTSSSPTLNGFAYSCFRDITAIVREYAEQPVDPATNYNAHATYSAIGDLGDTGQQLSHAGWSLVNIFTSPETLGHQLYLYDTFFGSRQDTNGVHVDWDGDGLPMGTISGFLVPPQIPGELNAAKVTCFVTEGDDALTGDYFAMNDEPLWDGTTSNGNDSNTPENIWNGKSHILGSADGVDIDTPGINPTLSPPQYITWASNILQPGNTSADIDLYTESDYWFMVYMILSFRSETTTGGSLSYLIQN